MKSILKVFGVALFILAPVIHAQQPAVAYKTLNTAVTGLAANTTNATAGTWYDLPQGQGPIRLYFTAKGTTGVTNGALIAKISTSYDTNTWDSADMSPIKVTLTRITNSALTASDWFQFSGVRAIRVGQIENGFAEAVTNFTVILANPYP